MRLTSLTIENLPGIDDPIEIPDIALDVNVVTGPNASGKSSIVRAVEAENAHHLRAIETRIFGSAGPSTSAEPCSMVDAATTESPGHPPASQVRHLPHQTTATSGVTSSPSKTSTHQAPRRKTSRNNCC